jgi:nitric oxide reductase NorE protein
MSIAASAGAMATDGAPQQTGEARAERFLTKDIWVFVLCECAIFTAYFIVYMLYRGGNQALFLSSQQRLDPRFGVCNTLILLFSSWLIANCVYSARAGRYRAAINQCAGAMACGVLFVGLKIVEWWIKIHQGLEFSTNEFFWFYYFLTAIHVLHVLIGFIFLSVVMYQLSGAERRSQTVIETGAIYWHMVDLLWVMIFAIVYVMR